MSKTVTFTDDVFPYCVGDVIVLNDDELKAVDTIAKARKHKVYVAGSQDQIDSAAEEERQKAARDAAGLLGVAESEAEITLREESAKKAEAEAHTSPSGTTTPGTAGGTEVTTAAAAGKNKSK